MRNEALETHAVRHVELLAVPSGGDTTPMLAVGGGLVSTRSALAPRACAAETGDCLAEVRARDDSELATRTDESDLGLREEVVLDFGAASGEVGLALTARHSLVSTYLFYQSLAYAGSRAGELLAALERGEPGVEDRVLGLARELGGIEVLIQADGRGWVPRGRFDEAGPIAADRQLIPLGTIDSDDLRVKLRMAKGSWRIDEVGLVEIVGPAEAVSLRPDSVTPVLDGGPSAATAEGALERLADPDAYLVTVPGDAHRIWFTVPDGGDHELFLDTRGYYYEWMRGSWLEEEDDGLAASILFEQREALKRMAPGFKAVEAEMEHLFWSSRFRR